MNIVIRDISLPNLIDRASKALLGARSSAEVLEARNMATVAYTAAKLSARFSKAKDAHDTVVAAAHRAQADALEIEAGAKRRLADEYDAAQERGEVGRSGTRTDLVPDQNEVRSATAADVGLSRKEIHEARQVRDAEQREPGIVRQALDAMLREGKEPSRASLRRAIIDEPDEEEDERDDWASSKDAFLLRSNEARQFAIYSGKIDADVRTSAEATASVWCRLVDNMKGKV